MKSSLGVIVSLGMASVFVMGAQCGGEQVRQCQDSEGRLVACPDEDAGSVVIRHDAGPRPDAGSADTGRNLPYEAACTAGEQGGCRFACLETPAGWPNAEAGSGFCTKPCATHADCGDPNLYRCDEVDAEYLCVRDDDRSDPTVAWAGPNADRTLVGAGSVTFAFEAHDDRSLVGATATVNGAPVSVESGAQTSDDSGVHQTFTVAVNAQGSTTVAVEVRDGAGQMASLSKTLDVDESAPSVSLVENQNLRPGGCVPSPSSVAVQASDNDALIHVRILVDNAVVATILPTGNGQSIDTSTMVDYRAAGISSGTHTLKAVAEDLAGNTAEDSVRLRIMTNQSSGNPCD
jgi:hypothetical protein